MIRASLTALLCSALATAALADPVPPPPTPAPARQMLTLTPDDLASWPNATTVLERCIGAVELRHDPSLCQGLETFLQGFAARVEAAQPRELSHGTP